MTTPHAELRELSGRATPLPWTGGWVAPVLACRERAPFRRVSGITISMEDSALLLAAVNALPTLLSEVERLRAALEQADVVMEAAMLRGLFSTPETQRSVAGQLWATAHQAVRAALATSAGGG